MRISTTLAAVVLTLSFSAMGASSAKTNTVNQKRKTQRVEANLDTGCRFAVELPVTTQGGVFTRKNPPRGAIVVDPMPKTWNGRGLENLYFQLTCLDAEVIRVENDTASFDPQSGTWKKDVAKRMKKAFGYEMSPQEYQRLYEEEDKAIRVYNVTALNAKGYASTVDDMIGDERKREKRMGFCLFNPPKALCGGGVVGYLADGPNSDLTQRALEILRTIEFLPDEE